jgi:hypothetical protein
MKCPYVCIQGRRVGRFVDPLELLDNPALPE